MLTRGPTTEILASHEDAAGICGVVEYETLVESTIGPVAPVPEEIVAKEFLLTGRGLEETGWNDLVSIYILQWKRNAGRYYYIKFLFHILILFVIWNVSALSIHLSQELYS